MIKEILPKKIKNQKGFAATEVLVVGAVVAVIAIIGAYELGTRNNTAGKGASNKTQNATAQKVVNSPAVSANQNVLNIKEYGISVPLSSDLQGISYVAQSNPQHTLVVVDLKSDVYTTLTNKCIGATDGTPQNLAVIVKTKGQYSASQNPNVTFLKQFKDFYIANIGGSQSGKITCRDASVQADYDALFNQLNSGLQASFANATLSS